MKIKEMVTKALADYETHVKLAGAQDVPEPRTPEVKVPEVQKTAAAVTPTEKLDLSVQALKIAGAVDIIAANFQKLAEALPTFASDPMGAPKHTVTKPSTVPYDQAVMGPSGAEDRGDGNRTGIETNRGDYSKTASDALAVYKTKLEQAAVLQQYGQPEQAQKLAHQARTEYEGVKAKLANADCPEERAEAKTEAKDKKTADVNQQKVSFAAPAAALKTAGMANSDFDTTLPGAPNVGSNESLVDMTKRQALTARVKREVAPYLREPALNAAQDKAISDNFSHGIETAKIAKDTGAMKTLLKKIASKAQDPQASAAEQTRGQVVVKTAAAVKNSKKDGVDALLSGLNRQ